MMRTNPLASYVNDSLKDEDKYYELWGVDGGAGAHPIWNYLVDSAIHDPGVFGSGDVENRFPTLMITLKKLFYYYLLGTFVSDGREFTHNRLIDLLKSIDRKNYHRFVRFENEVIDAIKKDIENNVSLGVIRERIKDAEERYFSNELKKENKYFALYVILFLHAYYIRHDKGSKEYNLLQILLQLYQKEVLYKEEIIFSKARFIWAVDLEKEDDPRYFRMQANNLLFLLQNVWLYNPNLKMIESFTLTEADDDIEPLPIKLNAKSVGMFEFLDKCGFTKEGFREIALLQKQLLLHPEDIKELPLKKLRFYPGQLEQLLLHLLFHPNGPKGMKELSLMMLKLSSEQLDPKYLEELSLLLSSDSSAKPLVKPHARIKKAISSNRSEASNDLSPSVRPSSWGLFGMDRSVVTSDSETPTVKKYLSRVEDNADHDRHFMSLLKDL